MSAEEVAVSLVNTSPVDDRTVLVQAGGYAEHQLVEVTMNGKTAALNAPHLTVRLDAGCGSRIVVAFR